MTENNQAEAGFRQTGELVQVLFGKGRFLITFYLDNFQEVSREQLTKDRVTGEYMRRGENGKLEPVVGVETIYSQPGSETPGGYSWQKRKDIRSGF